MFMLGKAENLWQNGKIQGESTSVFQIHIEDSQEKRATIKIEANKFLRIGSPEKTAGSDGGSVTTL